MSQVLHLGTFSMKLNVQQFICIYCKMSNNNNKSNVYIGITPDSSFKLDLADSVIMSVVMCGLFSHQQRLLKVQTGKS